MSLSLLSPLSAFTLPDRLRREVQKILDQPVAGLLRNYPFRYEDRSEFPAFPFGPTENAVCLEAVVTDSAVRSYSSGKSGSYVEIMVSPPNADELSERLVLRFFRMPWIRKAFPVDSEVIIYGRVKRSGSKLVMDHPEYEIVGDVAGLDPVEAQIHVQRIVPIHRAQDGVASKALRSAVFHVLSQLGPETMPDVLRKPSEESQFRGFSRYVAVQQIHFPETQAQKDLARAYLALEEFFTLQLNVLMRRRRWQALQGVARCGSGELLEKWQSSLAFSLTGAQLRTIAEVREDLQRNQPMNRLVQGDVGSGKTFVALAAMLLAVESGCQAALMAPTQILAEQHFANFRKHLGPLGLRIALRTGNKKAKSHLELWEGDGPPHIVIGTHALIAEASQFENLGLVVIDEQHKFGVQQRAQLIRQGVAPHVLAMTATPIPRTLTMSVYGDLEVSIIDEMPAGRAKVLTTVRESPDINQVVAFLKQQVAEGRQIFLVYPLVEESETMRLRAATKEHEAWQQRLAPLQCGLLHGKLKPEQKEAVMLDFRDGKTQVLVATSVIEVGVDVPNATVMIIFEADRFGLAQLHQLRGRIGRGEHKGWCVLIPSSENPETIARLKLLEKTTDGFAVAEEDLRLRGPGDLLGTAQSGLPGLQLGDLVRDQRLVTTARKLANEILDRDPTLQLPENRHLRGLLLTEQQTDTLS